MYRNKAVLDTALKMLRCVRVHKRSSKCIGELEISPKPPFGPCSYNPKKLLKFLKLPLKPKMTVLRSVALFLTFKPILQVITDILRTESFIKITVLLTFSHML